ncbi:LacI family transcriptional regulator [Actinomadura madurae]|uniref:LacI family DNA-binding transcriptional regulator n=1 Tax=Actinomadura madurae TaxID=1993 RepID=UPI0020D25538|nr:LacI family DNA-binding transcriptional regulator [Actinomadura madurae]MCP9953910.1 LacI family transcriptional regulator [Actinomadura madurae]
MGFNAAMGSERAGSRPARATINDVAREAAVSPATVSRVLSGAKAVSADLERRVRAAVERLGYRPNPAAQGLLRGATHTIGMVVPDLSNPYFAEVLKGVTAAAEAADFRTLVSDTGENAGAEYAAALELSRWTDGVVLSSPRMTDEDLAALADRAPRLVCVNRLLPGRNVPAVVVDFEAGMAALCRHLRELGHRRVAYLRGPPRAWSERARQRALRAAAGPGFEVVQVACGSGDTDGYRAADAALAAGATAVVAFSDHVALGVLARLDELGVGVPAEVSLTGFDDTSLSRLVTPRLTTVRVRKQDLGRRAWELLTGPGRDVVTVVPDLVVRASTAPPAR